jgi:hypothetical protein
MRTLAWLALLGTVTGTDAAAGEGELALSPRAAFAPGARARVESVAALPAAAFDDTLARAQARGEPWTRSFLLIALRFAGTAPQGRDQRVEVTTSPGEWEPGSPLRWARVSIEDRGWMDDSVLGERTVVWIVPRERGGGLAVARGLRAWECARSTPESHFYSARPCP